MKIAMLSYNSILPHRKNGWVTDNLYMIQEENGKAFGAPQFAVGTLPQLGRLRDEGIHQVQQQVAGHWEQLADVLPDLDAVVIYVGDRGSEDTIQYAAERKLEPKKAMFVLCGCNEQNKRRMIAKNGFGKSHTLMCECGGRSTMADLAQKFIATGELDEKSRVRP